MKRLKARKAPGPDWILNQALQWGADKLIPLLTPIINYSVHMGHHPQAWKKSITVSIRKSGKGDYSQPTSYRPIALLNTIGKLAEAIIATRMSYWVETFHLLPRDHMGGRKLSGVEAALHLLLERIHACFKTENPVASLLMLDVSGAYDNVSHARLLHNLRKRQIPESVIFWIKGFLSDRTTVIKLPEYESSPVATKTGIPQGSPLSRILYLFYNSELVDSLSNIPIGTSAIGYVDDVGILAIGPDAASNNIALERSYNNADIWAKRHNGHNIQWRAQRD